MESDNMTDPAKPETFRFHIEADADSAWHDILTRLGFQPGLEPDTPIPVPDRPTPDQLILELACGNAHVKIEALGGEQPGRTLEGDAERVTFRFVLPVLIHAVEPNGIAIEIHGPAGSALLSLPNVDRDTVRDVAARNARAGWALPEDVADKLKPIRKRRIPLTPLPGVIILPADRATKSVIEAISNAAGWTAPGDQRFRRAYQTGDKRCAVEVGYRDDLAIAEQLWERLRANQEAVIKAHFVLWARAYEQGADRDGTWAILSIPQFLDDCGVKRHRKGGHKPERKRHAKDVIEALMRLELAVTFTRPNGKEFMLSGPVWTRGIEAASRDTFSDLFGAAGVGDPRDWEPEALSYRPGPWFDVPEWVRHNRYTGRFSQSFLSLQTDQDQYAIRIGGYLHCIGRIEGYGPIRCRVGTLLKKAGIPLYRERRKTIERCERAFETLCEKGIKGGWNYADDPSALDMTDYDLEDPEQIARAFPQEETEPARGEFGKWLRKVVVFHPGPWEAPERERLEHRKALASGRKKRRKAPALGE